MGLGEMLILLCSDLIPTLGVKYNLEETAGEVEYLSITHQALLTWEWTRQRGADPLRLLKEIIITY